MNTEIDTLFHDILEQEGRISDDDMYKHFRIYIECIHDIALRLENLQKETGQKDGADSDGLSEALTVLQSELLDLVATGHSILDKWIAG